MLPWPRTRVSRCSSETSFRSPVIKPAHRHLEQVTGDVGADPGALQPRRHRSRVPLRGVLRRPRRFDRDVLGHPIDLQLRERDRDDRERADLRDEARVAASSLLIDEQVRTLHPRLVGRDTDLAGEPKDCVVLWAEPRSTTIDRPIHRTGVASRCGHRHDRAPRARRPTCRSGVSRRAAVRPA